MLPMLLIAAAMNPIFNHQGATILTYLWDGNPLTLESIWFGLAAAVTMVGVVNWFSCYNAVMTSDKFVYLFGRIIPALSLVLSMALRLVPKFNKRMKTISNAQKSIGRMNQKGLIAKLKSGIRVFSIMITWALEEGIETADSMNSRGYGLPGRSAFSIYKFDSRDKLTLAAMLVLAGYIIAGSALGGIEFRYFPVISGIKTDWFALSVYAAHFGLCAMPLAMNILEEKKWKAIQSKI